LASLANSLIRMDDVEQGQDVARSAVEAAAAVGAPAQQADALITLGSISVYIGDAPAGLTALRDGLGLAERHDLHGVALRGYVNLSDALELLGQHTEAAETARAGVILAGRVGQARSHGAFLVGNLAERAAEVIGADSLLVRVAAYYHDVGKLERPWAFIENQADSLANVHDTLDPVASAQVIAAHVTDGVKLAEKYRLPPKVREMIPQHHGTRTISFFYQQASERSTENVDAALFTYPGPRPQTREAAILMLSDSTEAAARAARDHSREAIEHLVERIIRQRLEEGQFDDCNLTLRDLTRIKQSFVTLLTGIYHPRIPYPPAGNTRPTPDQPRTGVGTDVAATA